MVVYKLSKSTQQVTFNPGTKSRIPIARSAFVFGDVQSGFKNFNHPLHLEPSGKLDFAGPFNAKSKSVIVLTNKSRSDRIAFKVKSTAPKGTLIVKPNAEVISPDQKIEVTCILRPVSTNPNRTPANYKILIQSVIVDHKSLDLESIWRNTMWKNLMVDKLQCVYNMFPQTDQTQLDTASNAWNYSPSNQLKLIKNQRFPSAAGSENGWNPGGGNSEEGHDQNGASDWGPNTNHNVETEASAPVTNWDAWGTSNDNDQQPSSWGNENDDIAKQPEEGWGSLEAAVDPPQDADGWGETDAQIGWGADAQVGWGADAQVGWGDAGKVAADSPIDSWGEADPNVGDLQPQNEWAAANNDHVAPVGCEGKEVCSCCKGNNNNNSNNKPIDMTQLLYFILLFVFLFGMIIGGILF